VHCPSSQQGGAQVLLCQVQGAAVHRYLTAYPKRAVAFRHSGGRWTPVASELCRCHQTRPFRATFIPFPHTIKGTEVLVHLSAVDACAFIQSHPKVNAGLQQQTSTQGTASPHITNSISYPRARKLTCALLAAGGRTDKQTPLDPNRKDPAHNPSLCDSQRRMAHGTARRTQMR
jgi:hypothetical protein